MKLIILVSFIILFLAIPFPSYNPETKAWFPDASLGQSLLGKKSSGVPLYKVADKVARSSVTSPLELSCEADSDCMEYIVTNQCNVYCGNTSSENQNAITQLNRQRVCDPSKWSVHPIKCSCIARRCINLK